MTTLGGPSETVLEDPGVEVLHCVFGETEVGVGDALEDVVVVLGCPENARRRVRNIPAGFGQHVARLLSRR